MTGIDAPGGPDVPGQSGGTRDSDPEPYAFPPRPPAPPAPADVPTEAAPHADPPHGESAHNDPADPAKQVCGALRLDLGAYVLGTLDETETQWIRSHVAICPECRAEYDELAVLPSFLARLTPAEAEASGAASEVSADRLLATATERLHRARRTRL
ncbi:MAG: hypothetical protein HOV68_18135, partial [Streptomycetaceae bacterium]|nr:hypothetical protein [Streptomycetaceae bacterium]